jgi:hypothetical protein
MVTDLPVLLDVYMQSHLMTHRMNARFHDSTVHRS